ncbi:nitroreductase family protein [Staphylococcus simulans]|uniref:nitroreductase family protein n=1 Tax=Staphylococcus simulans TaxID=1286 RepID=UPI000D1E1A52|nr:nitroreductase family protein [Staphylococcus simulans]MDY5060413.1 nitroreductase family protein [Staphylococcus simulans]PTJ14921.1 nitroreductase family protein [Staphylococcus simulans]
MENFADILNGRKSVKGFDPEFKIPKEEMNEMLEKAATAPSSVNMQPWRVAVVESDEAKAKLRPLVQFNTNQNDTSSAMLVIFGDLQCYENAEYIYDSAVEKGMMPQEVRDQILPLAKNGYKSLTREQMSDIVKIDSSLMAMQLMLIAKQHGYDTNPIGGFEADKIGEVLGYPLERYVPVMIIAIGKQAKAPRDSFRMPTEKFVEFQ